MSALRGLLESYARGDTDVQHQVLAEVEPLLFGYARSLERDHFKALAATHALTLSFHLRACAGALDLRDPNALRAWAHRAVSRRLAAPAPPRLADLADPETASMIDRCLGIGLALEEACSPAEVERFAAWLESGPPPDAALAGTLRDLGLTAPERP